MKRGGWIQRHVPLAPGKTRQPAKGAGGLKQRKPIPRKSRTKKERKRIYGVDDRQDFLRDMPCLGCARMGSDERTHHLHHVKNGGMGKKAGAAMQVPLCAACHHAYHTMGRATFEAAFSDMLAGHTLDWWAAKYAAAFLGETRRGA